MTDQSPDQMLRAAAMAPRGPARPDIASPTPSESPVLLDLLVSARAQETPEIISLELVAPDGAMLPAHQAGAHVDVHLGDALVRQYSLCGDPADRSRYRLAILLDPRSRGGSQAAHARLVEGAVVRIGAPRNHFPLREDRPRSLLLAGGIGITPLLAMAYRLHALGRAFELRYCTRGQAQTAFADEIAGAGFAAQCHFHYDDGPEAQRLDLDRLLGDHIERNERPDLYVCGPRGYIDWVVGTAQRLGWPDEAIHREYFGAEADLAGDAFTVEARRSGKTVTVGAGQSIAEALEAAGVAVALSCEEGVCGTCMTRVLAGVPDHRDLYLSAAERASNEAIMICCSRACSPTLSLDI
ncbi:PDR/VanB family oxidoreductase [Novosphingobium album (ex Liu et al. 2023)]|uniref:PDR/VanB family oxidoreductase n=1 Tax=Novosphingobium album (ex Liu et al. 2023) TaxID=3031130 RepID=A0ABT5WRC7_9SPHN|nr:PDR/VanB family oxidoreductase [Novosphingobium album (ex Liu et al. 2023)]MDE8651538.1 PDR/VanB family oxidoreductase [Novosphingobium album (ex Liu et al. 2023)]